MEPPEPHAEPLHNMLSKKQVFMDGMGGFHNGGRDFVGVRSDKIDGTRK